jgi:hypothetical protein
MTKCTMTHLDFSAILSQTRLLNIQLTRLRHLMKNAGMEDPEFIAGLDYGLLTAEEAGCVLDKIIFGLDLIAETPNACINQEALAAFHEMVENVDRGLKDEWVQSLFDKEPFPD